MEELDGDDVRVSYNGREASRDIVQVSDCMKNQCMSSSKFFALKQRFVLKLRHVNSFLLLF